MPAFSVIRGCACLPPTHGYSGTSATAAPASPIMKAEHNPPPSPRQHEDDTFKFQALVTAEAPERAGRSQASHPWTPKRVSLKAGWSSCSLDRGKGAIGFQDWRLTRPLVPVGLIRLCSKFFSSELSSNCLWNGFREADLLSRYVGSADDSP